VTPEMASLLLAEIILPEMTRSLTELPKEKPLLPQTATSKQKHALRFVNIYSCFSIFSFRCQKFIRLSKSMAVPPPGASLSVNVLFASTSSVSFL